MILEARGLWKSINMGSKSIQNGLEIDAKMMIESKIAFWRHLGCLGAHLVRLEGHLGAQRDGLDAILGPLGRSGRRFGVDFGRIWWSQSGPERRFLGSGVEKCKIVKSFVSSCVFHGF